MKKNTFKANFPHHTETNQLICNINESPGFYMFVKTGFKLVNEGSQPGIFQFGEGMYLS